ncbi:hypothetical protein NDU88_005235 [Pleurodeles waltl]|uniref:Uncharacterized protein n=1 Tax=Pleurodeles waltl TaxID=8319 RepID=A0AAV7LM82_PLEWA|nr:hypothetical protein NDU88_005235 [Pleurodeles waltl]
MSLSSRRLESVNVIVIFIRRLLFHPKQSATNLRPRKAHLQHKGGAIRTKSRVNASQGVLQNWVISRIVRLNYTCVQTNYEPLLKRRSQFIEHAPKQTVT